MDKKTTYIIILIAFVVFLLSYIGTAKYKEQQRVAFEDGFRKGQLYEQRNAIAQLQATGIYTISVINEDNETQLVRLDLVKQRTSIDDQPEN